MRVLVADDDPVSRRLLEAVLRNWGYNVTVVPDGDSAWAALQDPEGPRLAILDWMMPGMDGPQICRLAREHVTPYAYVLLLTARDRQEDLLNAFEAGADDFLVKPFDHLELRARLRTGARILELQRSLITAQEALRYQATHDGLTGIPNRASVLEALGRELDRAQRETTPLSVILGDVDHFKRINDTHGHAAGDEVLRATANRLRQSLRPYDVVGRYGGEEFLIVAPGCKLDAAVALAERVRERLTSELVIAGSTELRVTASFGVAELAPSEDLATLVRRADDALYAAKAAGRDRVLVG